MLNTTFRAILKGDRLQWSEGRPPEITGDRAVSVDVTILDDQRFSASRYADTGEKMAAFLEKLAASQATKDLEDPVSWQRQVRSDRPLPGRD
jgi:hypothetical protein